jgi:hypothetical protein
MNVEVTSVSKKPEKQTDAAAAIFVITSTEVQRWGLTNIPEALRRVPVIYVARIDANNWAITSRGFNSRSAAETQGGLVSVTTGNENPGIGNVRHGGKLQNGRDYRIYAKHQSYAEGYYTSGAHDDWRSGQVGLRTDWSAIDLGNRLQFDSTLRYMGAIEINGIDIDSYVEIDLQLGREARPGLDFSLTRQNLPENHHGEFLPDFLSTQPTGVERSIYGRVTWRY